MNNADGLYIQFDIFGKKKLTKATVYVNGKPTAGTEYDRTLWVERPEDEYALSAGNLKGIRVAVVKRRDWLEGHPL